MSMPVTNNEWVLMAEMDLKSAEYLQNMRPIPIEIICFHCQQAAEKMLKGVLSSRDIEPPKTHDLLQLCKQCCQIDGAFEQFSNSCICLTPYGVQVRYPSNLELDETDMKSAIDEARRLFDFILDRFFSPQIDNKHEPNLSL